MDARSWIERVAGEAPATVAKKIGLTTSTFDSQMKSAGGLKPQTVVAIAREYGYDPVAALVEIGLITSGEAAADTDLSEAEHISWLHDQPDDVLLAEIGRRFEARRKADLVVTDADGNVRSIIEVKGSKGGSGKPDRRRPDRFAIEDEAARGQE